MSSYEHARLRQMAERELRRRIEEAVEAAIEQYLEDQDDYLDPFNRERLKRTLMKSAARHIDRVAEWTATETLRRAGADIRAGC